VVTQNDRRLLGKGIRKYLRAAGLTQEKLAERVDINPVYLGQTERGYKVPTVDVLFPGKPFFPIVSIHRGSDRRTDQRNAGRTSAKNQFAIIAFWPCLQFIPLLWLIQNRSQHDFRNPGGTSRNVRGGWPHPPEMPAPRLNWGI